MMLKLSLYRSLIAAIVPIAVAAAGTPARAQPGPQANPEALQDPYAPDDGTPVEPTTQPPAPPVSPPPVQVQPAQPAATGQWVHTQQYGWVWMPYGDQYVYSPESTTDTPYPSEYVYLPSYGWGWVNAPWVWGWGPEIYFGVGGPGRYHWFHHRGFVGHGEIRAPGFHGGSRGHVVGGHVGGSRFVGGHVGGGRAGGSRHFGGGGHVGGGGHAGVRGGHR